MSQCFTHGDLRRVVARWPSLRWHHPPWKTNLKKLQSIGPLAVIKIGRDRRWTIFLVGGLNPSEKYESQLGWLFPIYGKIKMATKPPTTIWMHRWAVAVDCKGEHHNDHKLQVFTNGMHLGTILFPDSLRQFETSSERIKPAISFCLDHLLRV